jgi:hypothetical protein
VDPVSKILMERERTRPRLLPWVVLAVLLHTGAAAATYIVGRRATSRPIQPTVVSVKLVRPQAPARRAPSRRAPSRSTPVPQPSKPPATAVPQPTAIPAAPPAEPDKVQASADAMRSEDSRATPAPTPPPPEPGAGGGRGLSVGSNGAGGAAGIPADFRFTYYIERMLALIESRWYKPAVPQETRARVGFVILKSGRIEGIPAAPPAPFDPTESPRPPPARPTRYHRCRRPTENPASQYT